MSAEDQTQRLLSELGLNEYETRAYLSVIEGGILVAREISDRASIPYAKSYQTLNDLIDKRLIIGDEGRPRKFRARHPNEAIDDRLATMEKDWLAAHNKRKELLASILPELITLYEASEVEEEEVQGVWNITGLTNIATRLSKLVANAEHSIIVITGSYERFKDTLYKSVIINRDVDLFLITGNRVEDKSFQKVAINSTLGDATIILIDEIAMLTVAEIQKGKYSAGEYTAVLTQIRELVISARITYGGFLQ